MTNPFENDNYTYKVLINEEGQYSLWPAFLDVPIGWNVVYEEASRQSCLEYVEYNWKDLDPKSNQVREKILAGKR
ncbi:MbtH family protein [Bacillus sp. 22475]|uniref:MbtH family protein n=1 Tax=Bacillus sp. 22475 TaxID=3453925 RepID=UPI003F84CB7E